MSMVFAGFMAARKEDRLRQETIELEEKKTKEERDWQLKLRNLTAYDAQKEKDDELAKNVDWFMSSYKIDSQYRPSIAKYIENIGLSETMELYNDDKLTFGGVQNVNPSRYSEEFDRLTTKYNLPEGYLMTTGMLESSLDPMNKNENSSAEGLFMFTDPTAKEYGVDKYDWKSSSDGAARFAKDNFNNLSQMLGRAPTAAELYLAHQQGAGGAASLLRNPTKLAKDVVGADAVKLNGGKLGMTAEEFANLWIGKYEKEAAGGLAGLISAPVTIGSGKGKSYEDYAKDASSYATTQRQISIAEAEGAPQDIIDQLTKLAETQHRQRIEEKNIESGINSVGTIEAIVTKDDGTKNVEYVTFEADGKAYVDGEEVNATRMSENMMEMYFKVPTQTQKTARDYTDGTVALAEGLRNAQNLIEIAERNPGVTGAEGDVSQFVVSFVRGGSSFVKVANDLFSESQDPKNSSITIDEYEAELRRQGMLKGDKSISDMTTEEMVDALISETTQDIARDTTLFEAQMVALAFRVGRLEGQSGNAMSNKDFERIQEMVGESGGDPEAFRQQLHEFMRQKIKSNDDRIQLFNTTASGYGQFESVYGVLPYKKPQTIADFAVDRKDEELLTAIDFFRDPYAAPITQQGPASSEPLTPEPIGNETGEEKAAVSGTDPKIVIEEKGPAEPPLPVKDKAEWANNLPTFYYWDNLQENYKTMLENDPEMLAEFLKAYADIISKDHGITLTGDDLATVLEGK